ncbi:MAG: RNA 2',3'-cyclic phosphodiesterase [Firmicutes bacterium]|nr:RNA 2',3'-cyclic phosphodiesterase [Bacillota bacterium]
MRFFIALEIPEESRQQLEAVQREIKQVIPDIRLTNPEKLHLTIAFIGEEPEEMREKLVEVIKEAVWDTPPFAVTPAYIDGFPSLHQAHTFWIGVKGDIDKLFVVRERIKDGLVRLGLEVDERRYIPHIAVGKVGKFKLLPFQESELEKITAGKFNTIRVNCIKLFESIPEEGFHRHNTLAEVPLSAETT